MSKVFVLYLIVFLNLTGVLFRWYWTVPYYDKPVHFLGGLWVAMIVAYLFQIFSPAARPSKFLFFFLLIGLTMVVGFFWEVYELGADLFIFKKNIMQKTIVDTLTDLLADFGGAFIYSSIIVFFRKK